MTTLMGAIYIFKRLSEVTEIVLSNRSRKTTQIKQFSSTCDVFWWRAVCPNQDHFQEFPESFATPNKILRLFNIAFLGPISKLD